MNARTPFWRAVGLVARREITVALRSKAFLISSAIFLLGAAAAVVFGSVGPQLFASTTTVAVTSELESTVGALPDVETTLVDSQDEARELVESGDADAAVLPGDDPSGLLVIGDREAPGDIVQALSIPPEVELLDPNAPDPLLTYFIGIAFGIVFFSSAITFGSGIAGSVVEEKQTRIIEILLAAVPARALLTGKVIGNSIMAFAQIALIAAVVLITATAMGNTLLLDGLGAPIVWFVALFTAGFVLLAALYAAAAALVSRVEDLGSTTSPIMMLVMIPYILVIVFNNNPVVLGVMSYVPFSAPVAVPMRVYLSITEWWEPLVSLGIIVATTALVLMLAARIYERSLLRTGKRVRLSEALKG